MKNIYKKVQLGLVAAVAIFTTSCSREGLEDVMSKETFSGVSISVAGKSEIGEGSKFTLTSGELTIPVTLKFSAPTTRAFMLGITAASDAVPELITSGVLPEGTLGVPVSSFNVASTVQIPIGVSSFDVNLKVGRTFIEVNYGKNIALALQIANPAKDNTILEGQNTTVVLIKTAEVMTAGSVHDISVGMPGATSKIFDIPTPGAYDINSEIITIRVPISIQGELGPAFTVNAVVSPDSVIKYSADGSLGNIALYDATKISVLNPTVNFDPNVRTAYLSFTTKRNDLLKMQPAPGAATVKMPTVAFTLKSPSKFQVNAAMSTIYVKLNPNFFRPYSGTYFVIKGAIGAVSDPIYAANYDFGGKDVAWWDNGGKSGDGNWRFPDEVDISGDYNPRTAIGWTANNEFVTFTCNVEESGTYQMDMYFGSGNSNGRYTVFMDNNALLNGIQTAQNTGAHNNQKSHLHTVTLSKGVHIFKVFFNGGDPDYRGTIFTRKS